MSTPRVVRPFGRRASAGERADTTGIDEMINATASLLFSLLTRRLALVSAWPSAIHALATAGLLRALVDGWFSGTGSVELQDLHTSPERQPSLLDWMLDRDPAELLSPTLGAPPPILASWLTTRSEAAFDALEGKPDAALERLRAHHLAMVKHVRWCIGEFVDGELRRSESFTFDREKVNLFVDRLAAYIARNEGDEEEHDQTDQEVFEEHQEKLDREELVTLRMEVSAAQAELAALREVRKQAIAYVGTLSTEQEAMATEQHSPNAYKARQALVAAITRTEEGE